MSTRCNLCSQHAFRFICYFYSFRNYFAPILLFIFVLFYYFPGTFGDTEGLSSPACSGQCQPGYYCPIGSVNGTANRCPAGRYGAVTGLLTSSCSGTCLPGYYCPEGSWSPRQYQCANGPSDYLVHDPLRDGVPGSVSGYLGVMYTRQTFNYFIDGSQVQLVGSTAVHPNHVFCPEASSTPLVVLPGHYSVGNNMTTRCDCSPVLLFVCYPFVYLTL